MNLDIPDDKIAEAILRQLVGDRYGNASLLPAMQVAVKASEAQLASLARDAFAELLADPAFRASVNTSCPSAQSCPTSADPMKPVPPVTTTRICQPPEKCSQGLPQSSSAKPRPPSTLPISISWT